MDAFESFHPVPAAWLRDSDLAPFVPTYVRRPLIHMDETTRLRQFEPIFGASQNRGQYESTG